MDSILCKNQRCCNLAQSSSGYCFDCDRPSALWSIMDQFSPTERRERLVWGPFHLTAYVMGDWYVTNRFTGIDLAKGLATDLGTAKAAAFDAALKLAQ